MGGETVVIVPRRRYLIADADGSSAEPEWTEDGVRVVTGLREVVELVG